MAVSLTEYLTEIQELTKKNLEILKALNNSFYTKSEHLSVTIDNTNYVIPSFISLENKLNMLEDNLENLVNAPRTGEAAFNFNGNTQEIQVKGFTNVPCTAFENQDMETVAGIKTFDAVKNSVFKDFLTPTPFIKIDLNHLPDDIQQVNVKKIAVKNESLISLLKQESGWVVADPEKNTQDSVCRPISYANTLKKLFAYEADKDYVMYDKVYTLPIRYELGNGKYRILEIINNWTDDNFFEHYELKLDNLVYRVADETIEKNVLDGDYLITNNDKVKLLVEKVNYSTNTVQVKVEQGGFADLCTVNDENIELSTLKFFALGSINKDKYLNVPLEEDDYILVFLAPIQRNSLIQSAWSDGLFFHVSNLNYKSPSGESYEDFYKKNVTNIGDKLFGIVSMAHKDFVNVGEQEFKTLTTSKPVINTDELKVVLINKHMSNSETVEELYNLYRQKEEYKAELKSVQMQIDEINAKLSELSFEDTTVNRTIYTDQLSALNEKKKELTSSVANCIQQISIAASDTDTPVDNPKYHIRGFFDYNNFLNEIGMIESSGKHKHDVIKIEVQYRYKNANRTTGNAETINDNIFSDWNIMSSFVNDKVPAYGYTYSYPEDTSKVNEPSFNQIDIPISQGESVDLRLRVVYAVGYPFVKTVSDWSEITNIEFPVELRKNIQVLDIIKENNADTTKESFRGYLEKEGVSDHIGDKLVDQDVTFFHGPDHISSGFYTDERRVIPLRDKLQSLTNEITTLKDEVFGLSSENILVTISDGDSEVVVNPLADNTFVLKDYASSEKEEDKNNNVDTTLTLKIQNTSKTSNLKLFSMFPGNYNYCVNAKTQSKFDPNDILETYKQSSSSSSSSSTVTGEYKRCAPLYIDERDPSVPFIVQRQNQWMYFRITDPYNGINYYSSDSTDYTKKDKIVSYYRTGDLDDTNIAINSNIAGVIYPGGGFLNTPSMCAFAHLTSIKDICITEKDDTMYKLIRPGEAVEIPIHVMYYLGNTKNNNSIQKTLSFDLRTSLYSDPLNFKVALLAKYSNDLSNNVRKVKKTRYNPVVIN